MSRSSDAIRVLHVDDDPAILDLTESFLQIELDDPVVATETSAKAALARLESDDETFDCIISDYDMPEMDGLELFERIRNVDATLPFVLYTGKGSEEIASQAVNAGVTGYFQKGGPDQQRRLSARVRQAVEEHRNRIVADRYTTVLDALGYPIYVVDETGRFKFVNDPFVELTGYDRETIIGSTPELIKDDAAVATAESNLGDVLSSDGPETVQFEVSIVSKDGERIPCRDHMAILPYEGEEFRGSVGILQDTSAARNRKRELKFKRRAMDEAPIGITMTDPSSEDNPMIYVNNEFVEMTGYGRDEVHGHNCRFLQGKETQREPVEKLRQSIDAEEPVKVTLRNYRKNGEQFWNRVSVAPIRNERGDIVRWVGFQEDVTAYKEYEAELERTNARLEQFASVLSHDLRNRINVATGQMDLLRREHASEGDNGTEQLDVIDDALGGMESLVEDLLTLLQEGQDDLTTEPIDLATVVDERWGRIDPGDATLETEFPAGTESGRLIRADPRRLGSILENLFRNAVDHGNDGGVVTVGLLENGFYVADDGPGIPLENRTDVFEVGYSTAEDGTGFGLDIVNTFAEAHGWEIKVFDSADGGARFEITGIEQV